MQGKAALSGKGEHDLSYVFVLFHPCCCLVQVIKGVYRIDDRPQLPAFQMRNHLVSKGLYGVDLLLKKATAQGSTNDPQAFEKDHAEGCLCCRSPHKAK